MAEDGATRVSAERGWIIEPQPRKHSAEIWAQRHRDEGHHPYPAPTPENPEQWECKCDPDAPWVSVWRILTLEQIRIKHERLYGGAVRRKHVEDDPAWQEEIRQAKQRVAEYERSQETQ